MPLCKANRLLRLHNFIKMALFYVVNVLNIAVKISVIRNFINSNFSVNANFKMGDVNCKKIPNLCQPLKKLSL